MDGYFYTHTERTRNALTISMLLVCITFATFGYRAGAPWYWLLIVILPTLMLLVMVLLNRESGSRISKFTLTYYVHRTSWDIAIKRIASVRVKPDSDGPSTFYLNMGSGETIEIPHECIGRERAFIDGLRAAGVQVDAPD